jgi:hypothetical protein
METENKDWKPEVGEKVWVVAGDGIHEMIITKIYWESWFFGTIAYHPLTKQYNAEIGTDKLFPTAEAAFASIPVYDLEGKEVLIPHAEADFSIDEMVEFFNKWIKIEGNAKLFLEAQNNRTAKSIDTYIEKAKALIGDGAANSGKSDQREGGC